MNPIDSQIGDPETVGRSAHSAEHVASPMIPPITHASAPVRHEPEPLAPGAIRVRRSGLLAASIVALGVVIAAAGVISGFGRHSAAGPRSELSVLRSKSARVPASTAQPAVALPVGSEPGAPVTSEPVGAGMTAPFGPLTYDTRVAVPTPAPGGAVATRPLAVTARPLAQTAPAQAATYPAAIPQPAVSSPTADARDDPESVLVTQACSGAATRLDSMLCSDPGLAAQDRRVRRAFRNLMQAADDPETLAVDQARFRNARDRAAAHGDREGLQELYQQRLQELTQP